MYGISKRVIREQFSLWKNDAEQSQIVHSPTLLANSKHEANVIEHCKKFSKRNKGLSETINT